MRFPAKQRLRSQLDFKEVRKRGRTFRTGYFFLQLLIPETRDPPIRRLGIITSRRVGNAVKRNHAKRVLREIFRQNQDAHPENCDIVVVMRNTYNELTFWELKTLYLKGIRYLSQSNRQSRKPS